MCEIFTEAVATRRSVKKVFLEISQNSQENTLACNFVKKEALAQVFSCEFCEISQNTFSYRTPPVDVLYLITPTLKIRSERLLL